VRGRRLEVWEEGLVRKIWQPKGAHVKEGDWGEERLLRIKLGVTFKKTYGQ